MGGDELWTGQENGGMLGKRQKRDEPRDSRKSRKNGKSKWRLMELLEGQNVRGGEIVACR